MEELLGLAASTVIGLVTGLWFERRTSRSTALENKALKSQLSMLKAQLAAQAEEIQVAMATGRMAGAGCNCQVSAGPTDLEARVVAAVKDLASEHGTALLADVKERLITRDKNRTPAVQAAIDALTDRGVLEREGPRVRVHSA